MIYETNLVDACKTQTGTTVQYFFHKKEIILVIISVSNKLGFWIGSLIKFKSRYLLSFGTITR